MLLLEYCETIFTNLFIRLAVILENQIHLFSFPRNLEKLFSLDTRYNPLGLCEISPLSSSEKQLLVFPGHKIGSVQVVVSDIFSYIITIAIDIINIISKNN